MANRFLNNITINDEYTLPAADGTADQIITTDGAGQLSFVDPSTIIAGTAEKVVIYAKNTHTAQIAKGTPVYITGTVGATDTVQIAPADASNSAKMPAVGILDATLAVNAFGYVITGGFMDNITTDPIDGATPSSNDTVYVKAGGGLTLTKPTTAANLIQNIAKVGKVSGGNAGSLIVSSILRTNDVPNLNTGKIWVGQGNTIESSIVFLDEPNGRMGIGTTSPLGALQVNEYTVGAQGNQTVHGELSVFANSGDESLFLGIKDAAYPNRGWAFNPVTNGVNSDLQIKEHGSSGVRMTIKTGGNVGIGTTSPATNLHVKTISNAQGITIQRASTTAGTYGQLSFVTSTSDSATPNVYLRGYRGATYDDNYLTVSTNSTERIRVLANGNVGIGTTSPSVQLDIEDSSNVLVDINTTTANANTTIRFQESGSNTATIGYDGTNDGLILTTGGFTAGNGIFIDNSQNVGIGTPSPQYTLDVAGTIRVGSGGTIQPLLSRDSSTGGLVVSSVGNSGDFIFIGLGGSEKFRIKDTGEVGIGTPSPSQKLQVNGIGEFAGALRITETGSSQNILIGNQDSGGANTPAMINGVNGTLRFGKGNSWSGEGGTFTEAMRVNPDGNVGIGTPSPSVNLHVESTTSAQFKVGNGTQFVRLYADADEATILADGNVDMRFYTGGSEKMRINTSGNVGIGETNPIAALHINKSGVPQILLDGGSDTTGDIVVPAGEILQIGHWAPSTSTYTDRLRIAANGNVGIGTTSPDSKLHIEGSTDGTGAGADAILHVKQNGSWNANEPWALYVEGYSYLNGFRINAADGIRALHKTTSGGQLGFSVTDTAPITFTQSNSTERMRVHTNGNVGIGQTNPSQKLDVSGNIKMTETAATADTDKIVVSDSGVLKYRTGAQILSDIGGQASISAPNAPTNLSLTVVSNTINVTFNASTTSDIDAYLVYSSVDGSDYGLISIIPPDDFSATMSIIDDAFSVSGTQAYRVYAMKLGNMSSALTGSISYTVSTPLEPTNMSVVPLNTAYFVQWDPPSSNARFVTAYNVYKHEASSQASLARASATLVYSGMNTNYMYQVSGANNTNYHQFWVETTIA